MNFDLPIISAEANPDFRDARACADWLQNLPLINVGPTHGRLLGELEELNCCEISAAERLKILELLREPVLFVQIEHAKKFANRSVPLATPEREILMNVLALWTAFGQGYQHCLQRLAGSHAGLLASSGQTTLACQRSLWCAAQKITEHYRCYQQVSAQDWRLLHSLYAFAEEREIVDQQVDHPVNKGAWKTTCVETYVQPLLLHLANPSEQPPRQFDTTARWLDRWGANARITRTAPKGEGLPVHPLTVDIGGDGSPLRPEDANDQAPGGTRRFIDVTELRKSIRMRMAMLKKGDAPAKLGLGEDINTQLAERLLAQLQRLWCEGKPQRSPPRKSASDASQLASTMGAIHFYITGLPFRQPGDAAELTKAQHEELATFGRTSTRADEQYALKRGFSLESWQIRDESLAGLRLERLSGPGRFVHNQLVAIRPADARNYLLATICWLCVDENYKLKAGVRIMPGVPQGICIRATGLNAKADKYVPALMLSAVPALRAPESLILPLGWYRPRCVIEAYADTSRQLLLNSVIERGADFERITFENA